MRDQGSHDSPNVVDECVGAAGLSDGGDHRRGVGRGPGGNGAAAEAGQHPAAQQVGLLLPEPHRQARQMILDVAGGESLYRAWAGVMWIADGRGLGDEPFELAGLGACRLFGAALDEDPLTRDHVGSDDPVTGLGGGGGVDARAVLELGQRLLAVAGHDSGPRRGTQRYGCYGWPPWATLCPNPVPGSESTLHTPYPTRPNAHGNTLQPFHCQGEGRGFESRRPLHESAGHSTDRRLRRPARGLLS
jgi:hypothetical protein